MVFFTFFVEASLHVVFGLLGQLLANCADSRHFRPQFNEWQTRTSKMLQTSGLPKAGFRLQEVVGAAESVAKG